MSIRRRARPPGGAPAIAALTCLALAFGATAIAAQPPAAITAYRAPVIALVQPGGGGTVAQDRPTVVFRFLPGEAGDPLDVRSFAVAVDGADRTPLFQLSATEAWGPLAATAAEGDRSDIALGAHQLAARICSARGVCASVATTVTVVPAPGTSAGAATGASRRARLFEALLAATRRLVLP